MKHVTQYDIPFIIGTLGMGVGSGWQEGRSPAWIYIHDTD